MSNTPSKPPASDGNMGAIIEWCLRKQLQKTDGQMPAQVVKYDRVKNVATVQPLIAIVGTGGQVLARAPVSSVRVLALGGGGFFVNFPLQVGDKGWIEASDRDISLFAKTMALQPPNTQRMHSFEDGRFVPDVYATYTFAPTAGAMVISSLDGTTRIEMSPGKISLNASEIDLNATTAIKLNAASGAATLTMDSSGSTATGYFNLPLHTIINGRDFMGHAHTDPQGGNTGGVV